MCEFAKPDRVYVSVLEKRASRKRMKMCEYENENV